MPIMKAMPSVKPESLDSIRGHWRGFQARPRMRAGAFRGSRCEGHRACKGQSRDCPVTELSGVALLQKLADFERQKQRARDASYPLRPGAHIPEAVGFDKT